MEYIPLGAGLDDREEGEIVDDDFEDISDNSIIVPILSGKSVSPKEHLPAISLSSVTEADESRSENKAPYRRKATRKKLPKAKKRRNSHRKSTCNDSDSDDCMELDRKLQKQLKAAIRVNDTEQRHQNSLRTRLRGMTKLDESDSCDDRKDIKTDEKYTSDEGDNELAQLRLEALRTAVLNKFMHRKMRKAKKNNNNDVLSDVSVKTDNSETNKENNHNTVENCPKKICLENSVEKKLEITNNVENATPPEDDEDVLRALLLASMSKKITSKTVVPLPNNGIKNSSKNKEIFKQCNKAVIPNRMVKNNVPAKKLQLPEVKPLIINPNEDSDSDDDLFNETIKSADKVDPKQIDKQIENTVEKFLKEERAKIEAKLPPVEKRLVNPKESEEVLEKSIVKFLPKGKQVEYHELQLKLVELHSKKFNGVKKAATYTSKPLSKQITRTELPINKEVNSVLKANPKEKKICNMFSEIYVKKNGSLQIQEKYLTLKPLVDKINETANDKKKCGEKLKRLLQEVTDARKKLDKTQQAFNLYKEYFLRQKERIDKSERMKKSQPTSVTKAPFTSTPIKEQTPTISFETSSIPNTTPNNTLPPLPEPPVENNMEVDVVMDVPLNPGDPNDIDKIYSKQRNAFPKYISPLDNVKRVVTNDPFSIICPYDVDGNCRDPECIYKHLFK